MACLIERLSKIDLGHETGQRDQCIGYGIAQNSMAYCTVR